MQGQNLRQLWESLGPVGCVTRLTEALEQKLLRPEDFSVREIAEAFCGPGWVRALMPDRVHRYGEVPLQEAGEGVDVSAFQNITGQLLFNKIMEGWKRASRVADELCTTQPTKLDGEKMPWLAHVDADTEAEIRPGEAFPEVGFGERYIETPRTTKQGRILSLTKEAIFFDLTGQMLKQGSDLGEALAYRREKHILKRVLGVTNSYKLNGTSINTYNLTGNSNWVNAQASTPLNDWSDINEVYKLAAAITDPDTGLPLAIDVFKQLLVMPASLFNARRIVTATGTRTRETPGNASGYRQDFDAANPPEVAGLQVLSSPIAKQVLVNDGGESSANADEYWFLGDFKRAFVWMENWPLTVVQAPTNSIKEFEQDIVARWKASYRGIAAIMEPRVVFKMYNATSL